jgi:autoinducer-2 kinase
VGNGCVMAIDIGTGSCRSIIFDEAGQQLSAGQREWSHPEIPGIPGSHVFETARNWKLICEGIREALSGAGLPKGSLRAVATASMREGMVLSDAADREIWACANIDARGIDEAAELVRTGEAERLFDTGGDWVSITSAPRFRWIRRHQPEIAERTAHVSMLSDWVVTRLSGEHVTDPSCGSSSGLFDLRTFDWSRELIDIVGFDPGIFPPVVAPGTLVGRVTGRAAEETGLPQGTPVVVGGADTQLGLLGIGVTNPGLRTVVAGSFWQTTAVTDHCLIDRERRLRTLCHVLPGLWMVEGIGTYCGIIMRWFRDAFCEPEKAEALRRGVDPYVVMEEEAARIPPGSNGVWGIFGDLLDAKRWLLASPSFLGFNVEDPVGSSRAACIRAVEESAAYVTLGHMRIIDELTGAATTEALFTGGSAKGSLWPQIAADMLGVTLKIPLVKESTALATAFCAGKGVGMYDDLAEVARRLVRYERTVEPDPSAHERYAELYDRWREIYRYQLALVEAGLLPPLWRAPGVSFGAGGKTRSAGN